MSEAMKMMLKARTMMMLVGYKLQAGLAMQLDLIETLTIDTAGTNGKCILFNPHFVASLTPMQVVFLFLHEVKHVLLLHMFRRNGRDPEDWNIACDHQINLTLIDEKIGEFIPESLADPRFKGMASERIFGIQQREKPADPPPADDGDPCDDGEPNGPAGGSSDDGDSDDGDSTDDGDSGDDSGDDAGGSDADGGDDSGNGQGRTYGPDDVPTFEEAMANGTLGRVLDAPGDAQEVKELKAELNREITIAVMAGKQAGEIGADDLLAINGRNDSVVEWSEVLDDQLAQIGSDTMQTWSKKNRMFDEYLPGNVRLGFDHLVIGVDTSGSMDESELKLSVSEAIAIAEKYCPRVTFIPCDRRINPKSVQEFDAGNFPESADDITLIGGGGTDPQPVFDWIEEQGETPDALIFFTDGYVSKWPDADEVAYPVIWAITGYNHKLPPTGRVVELV